MDSDLNLNSDINAITKAAYYHLNILRIKGLLSQLVHAFVFSPLESRMLLFEFSQRTITWTTSVNFSDPYTGFLSVREFILKYAC